MTAIRCLSLAVVLACVLFVRAAAPPGSPTSGPTVTAEDLPRVKPTEASEAHKTFQLRPGFTEEAHATAYASLKVGWAILPC